MILIRIRQIWQAWWQSLWPRLQEQVSVTDVQYQRQQADRVAKLAAAATLQQQGLLEVQKRHQQQQLQRLAAQQQALEALVRQALTEGQDDAAHAAALQWAELGQQQQQWQRELDHTLQQLTVGHDSPAAPDAAEPLEELQQLQLNQQAGLLVQRLRMAATTTQGEQG